MKCQLRVKYQSKNIPLPSGGLFAGPLEGDQDIEFDADDESLQREVVTRLINLTSEDCRIIDFEVWVLLQKDKWDKPFEASDFPQLSPERCAELRAKVARILERNQDHRDPSDRQR